MHAGLNQRGLFVRVARVAVILLGVAACGGTETSSEGAEAGSTVRGVSSEEIVIGSHTDLGGATAIWGVGATNGARMRIDELNAQGGVHGRRIRYVVEDTQYQVPRAIQAANKLINRDNVFALLLSVGTPTNNAVMATQFEQDVPNLFPISGARSMVEPFHRLKFTQRGIYYDEIRAAVRYFVEEKDKQRVCAIYQDTEYGQEILEAVQDQAQAMGIEVAEVAAHKPAESEFTASILRLRKADCDLVAMGTIFRDTILILDAARKMDWQTASWVGNNAAYAQVIADSSAGQGYYAFVHMAKLYADDEMPPKVRSWWDAYVDKYDVEPGLAAMEGYRAADIMITAFERSGRELTLDGFVGALEGLNDYVDQFGYRVSFAPDKHSSATESVLSQVQDGRWIKLDQAIGY